MSAIREFFSGFAWPTTSHGTEIKEKSKVELKSVLKVTVAAGALLALAQPVDAQAGGKVSAGNSKVDITLGGRVHRSLSYVDDGTHDQVFHGAGTSSNSEIWITGEGKLTESVSMGAYIRWDIAKNQNGYSFGSTTGAAVSTTADDASKYEYIYFKSASMGTLSMGDIEPGADGVMETNFGGLAGDEGAAASATDITLSGGAFSGSEVTDFVGTIDPGADANRVRYDSPSFSGFSVSGDLEQGGGGSIAIKYSGTIAGFEIAAGLGYEADGGGDDIQGGAIGVKHSSGLHLAFDYGKNNVEGTAADPEWWRLIGGYDAKLNSLGNTNFTLSYSEKDDATTLGNEGKTVQVAIAQSLDAVGGKVTLQYDNYSFSNAAGATLQDVDVVVLETAFNF